MKVVIVCGQTGAGKTTFCDKIDKVWPSHIQSPVLVSVGKMLRQSARNDTSIRSLIRDGERVPDSMVISVVFPLLDRDRINILDNFPQSLASLRNLDFQITSVYNCEAHYAVVWVRRKAKFKQTSKAFLENRQRTYESETLPMLRAFNRAGGKIFGKWSQPERFVGHLNDSDSFLNAKRIFDP